MSKSFLERMNIEPVKLPQLSEVDQRLRNRLWNVCHELFFGYRGSRSFTLLLKIQADCFGKQTHFYNSYETQFGVLKDAVTKAYFAAEWYRVYHAVERFFELYSPNNAAERQILRDGAAKINDILREENSGYRLTSGYAFVRLTDEQQLEEITSATKPGDIVSEHLRHALRLLSSRDNPDFRNSVKESISAVEAQCRLMTGLPKATLGVAIKAITPAGYALHRSLQDGFDKLYGWSSDDEGIRHALQDKPSLTYSDALFMLVICSAFVNYLRSLSKN